uniref:maleylpyruvate isomerase family mycothiol-dependent enzyme n=1 Tax=Streptomyces sp. SBT349 TaxID=1580539 RepID=UPI00066E33DD
MRAAWSAEGTELFLRTLDGLGDDELNGPSALPGWTRRHVVAHVASNAEAIGRLLTWARTGKRTPMYASREQRAADIEAGALLAPAPLRAWARRSAADLAEAAATLPERAWSAEVVTAQGRAVPASETHWMRAREVCVHAVDLAAGVTFADLPDGFCAALADEVAARRDRAADGPALALTTPPPGRTVAGEGPPHEVALPLPDLAAYLTGRTTPRGLP